MRKWIWASTLLTVAVSCGLYAFANYAGQHPLRVLGYGARLATVAGMGHARVSTPRPAEPCPAPVAEMPNECPVQEAFEPIVVENAQPATEYYTVPPDSEVAALPPMPVYEEPPVMEMPPCPEDEVETTSLRRDNALRQLAEEHFSEWQVGPNVAQPGSMIPQEVIPAAAQSPAPNQGPVSDCQIDPNYHHLYPGCPWMGGSRNVPAFVPAMPIEETRTRPAKVKWLTLRALLERLGLSGVEECEEPAPANTDGDTSNLTDIIF